MVDRSALAGRICMVTGATSGLGAVTARELARLGGTVVVVGRDQRRCGRRARQLIRSTGADVAAMAADLSLQGQVRRLAADFRGRFGRLDVLVNNAGSYFMKRELTAEGLERTFALNHLAPFLLTTLLLDLLRASPGARVVNVSSSAHERGRIDFEDLQRSRRYDRLDAYGQSKLANLLFTFELARRLQGSRVTCNAVDPGLVATNLGSDNGWLRVKLRNLLGRGLLTPEQGARTSVYLAASPEVEGVSGRYYRECREARPAEAALDPSAAERLWRVSEELTGPR